MLGLTFNAVDGRITIFRSTLEELGWPTHYRFLYNRKAKQVAVQNCAAEDTGSHKTPKLNARNSCEIKCMAFVRMIYRDMRWDRDDTYRLGGGKKHPRTAACELRFIFTVFSGKRISSERNNQPHKAPVRRRNVLCGKFLGLVNKTRQWGSVRGVWRSRQKEAHRVTVQDAYKAARWNVTGWAGDSLDESTQQNSDYNHS